MAGFWDLKTLADGTYQIRTGALEGSGMLYSSWVSLPVPINWNAIEVSYAAVEELGYIKLILNGTYSSDGSVTKLNNPSSTVDSVRMGMLEMSPTNATGVISFDDFESRRFSEIGLMPEKGMDDTEALQEPGWAEKVYTYSNTHKHAVTSVTSETSQNTYEYDANGNMITRVENGITWTSTYNAENRLATMTDGTTTWLFSYDGDGNRVSHLISDGVTPLTGAGTQGTFYFMGGGFEVSSDGINQTVRKYYSIAGTTYAMSDNGTMNYLITDHLSSVVAVTDASGLLLEETRYMPFGSPRSDVGTVTSTDKSFTGQKALPNTGLLDYNARMYSSELGRFTQPDTIIPGVGNPQAWNRYSYTLNNPVKYTDPSGHYVCDEIVDGKCVSNGDTAATDPKNLKKNKGTKYINGYSIDDLTRAWQKQGTNNCGPFSLAIAISLKTGFNISGADVDKYLIENGYKFSAMGIPGILLFLGGGYYDAGSVYSYSQDQDISTIINNIDNGKVSVVGVSWQTTQEMGTQILENWRNHYPWYTDLTVGHWMVAVGYNNKTEQIILLNPGNTPKEGPFSYYSYSEFNHWWKENRNIFIGNGEIIVVQ